MESSHGLDLLVTLTGSLAAALVLGLLAQRLRVSPLVGYLLAGVAVGPFTPGFVASSKLASELAEVGVVLLLFGVGLHLHPRELLATRKVAVPGALAQIAVATGLGVGIGWALGLGLGGAVVFGLSLSVASTVVLTRVLADAAALETPPGRVAVGWLIVEDLFAVAVLVILPLVAGGQASEGAASLAPLAKGLGLAVLKLAALGALVFVAGRRAVPWLLGHVDRTGSRELFILAVLVIALGFALLAAEVFGASLPLGAFLAGLVVGQSDFGHRAAAEALPLRDAFAVLFFVSTGMLLDPAAVPSHLPLTLGALAIVLAGKPLVAFAAVMALRRPVREALTVAAALAQIGELSFLLSDLGRRHGLLSAGAAQSLVAAAIVSITLSPLLFRLVDPLARRLEARAASS